MRDLWQVVQVEAEVVGPRAGLRAPVLDDLEVVGLAEAACLSEGLAGISDERLDHLGPDRVQRPVLAGRGDDRPPAAGRACLGEGDLAEAAVELSGVVSRPDDVEGEVLEHPDADTVALWRRAVRAAEQAVVDRLGGACETVAVEGTIDDGRDPPAGDRILAELEEAGSHRQIPVSGAPSPAANAPAKMAAACSTDRVVGAVVVSPRSRAIEVEMTPGIPHGSMSSKSARSTVTFRAIP